MTHLRPLPTAATTGSLTETLRRHPRAFTFDELAGLASERKARTAIERGEAVRVLPNAYVSAVHADSFAAKADAALLWAGPNAALSGVAALFAWRFVEEPPEQIEIAVPHAERPYPPAWVKIRRLTFMPPTVRLGRATVVGPDLAVIHGYGMLPPGRRSEALYRAVRSGFVSPEGLRSTLDRVPRCLARKELVRRIESARRGAESFLEEKGLWTVFNTRDFARFARQHSVRASGRTYRLDMYDAVTMTAVELDGEQFHGDALQRQRDLRRDADLARIGIQTVRLTYRDITERPEWCRALVRGVIEARTAR
ncbi:DUF559 domain-containing protein [Demequina sp.]|uniref:endonuclease domain-containing protein n=1 Tax=Demequina sp. TaxID=2050685 RepID=UPI0025FC822A|nr:DUF559 domain-containing protein [Demequina sp.]